MLTAANKLYTENTDPIYSKTDTAVYIHTKFSPTYKQTPSTTTIIMKLIDTLHNSKQLYTLSQSYNCTLKLQKY